MRSTEQVILTHNKTQHFLFVRPKSIEKCQCYSTPSYFNSLCVKTMFRTFCTCARTRNPRFSFNFYFNRSSRVANQKRERENAVLNSTLNLPVCINNILRYLDLKLYFFIIFLFLRFSICSDALSK